LAKYITDQSILRHMAQTPMLALDDDVATELRKFYNRSGRAWMNPSVAINEVILRGIRAFDEDAARNSPESPKIIG
jgi:hypothetical protein